MKNINKFLAVIILSASLSSCTEGFEEINTNPNEVSEINPSSMLNPVIYNIASSNARKNYDITSQLMQVHFPYPSITGDVHRYHITQGTGNAVWNDSYDALGNINEMLQKSYEVEDENYIAINLTLRAFIVSNLTDMFGSVPFSEAFQAEQGNFTPKFDKQQDIYSQILEDLENANSLYVDEDLLYADDILYANDVSKWQKFTNSLHLRLLLRISDRQPDAWQKIEQILNNPTVYPVFQGNGDAAVLTVTGVTPNLSPWPREQDFSNARTYASFFIDQLNELEDPRLPIFANEARDLDGNTIGYQGIPAGFDDADSEFQYTPSGLRQPLIIAPMPIILMSYSELEFIKAEAAIKAHYNDAETHYRNGVRASIEFWTEENMDEAYFENEFAAYNGTLERIMTQKYLALFFTDYQQWSEYRRTGFPVMPVTNSMENGGKVPSRLLYPDSPNIYNSENFHQAIQEMGGDEINIKVWWDVN